MPRIAPELIDEVLPQTQCGLCGYKGCMPYAEAIAFDNAALNLCTPGGVTTLHRLGNLLNENIAPLLTAMAEKTPAPVVAIIRESECIGCLKCIKACPVDAIIGGPKLMHSIIQDECTGCELCVPVCPVDCIDLIATQDKTFDAERITTSKKRYYAKEKRALISLSDKKNKKHSMETKRNYIKEALERARNKAT